MEAGTIWIKTKIDNSGFEKDAKDLKGRMNEVGNSAGGGITAKIGDALKKAGGLGKGLLGTVGKVATGIIGGVGRVIAGVVAGAVRIGAVLGSVLGTIGFLGAVMALVASAFKRVVDENKELVANIKYIIYLIGNALYNAASGLANFLASAISNLINLVAKLLVYLDYIFKVWFGISLLTGASIEGFRKSQEATKGVAGNLGRAAKNAKELKKQLAGFDEMNVLQDNTDTGAGGGAGGGAGIGGADFVTPTIDIDALKGDIPEWVKWIADHKDEVIAGLLGIAGAMTAISLGLDVFKAIGFGAVIGGIVYAIENLIKYLNDPTWESFGGVITGIGVAIAGIGIMIASLPVFLAGVLVAIIGVIVANWEKIRDFLQSKIDELGDNVFGRIAQFLLDAFNDIFTGLRQIFDGIIEFIKGVFTGDWDLALQGLSDIFGGFLKVIWGNFKRAWSMLLGVLLSIGSWLYSNVIEPVINFFKGLWDKILEIFNPAIEIFKSIFGTIFENLKITIDNIKQIIGFLWNTIMSILKPVFTWIWSNIIKPVWDKISEIINNVKNAFTTLVSTIKSIFSPIVGFFQNIVNTIWGLIKSIATTVGNVIAGAFKSVINAVLGAIQSILNTPIRAINGLIGVINKVPGINLTKLKTFSLPRLAMGGIINNPGRGVAIGGEAGAEGVIPLTNSQQMELLGEAIGKYITVNASITNTMNGRVISRELQKINNENDFAFNR